ncbi:3'-5' exoribonuclease [Rapidithrix thailandica]|uniref:3'-5' exoribonuclease n=1 Tax=Rapidithrix thailandica TaxID=413964 RepID=A0AAW9SMB3_9BACT
MHLYLDTEYALKGNAMELLSIGLVKSNGEEYYAVSSEFNPENANDWLKANVLPKLEGACRKGLFTIKEEIEKFIGGEGEGLHRVNLECWGYFCAADWTLLVNLFGGLDQLPSYMPLYCKELRQEMDRMKFPLSKLPKSEDKHHALADARRNWVLHQRLLSWEQEHR